MRERILTPPSLIERYELLLGKGSIVVAVECFWDQEEERYYHDVTARPSKDKPFQQLSFKVRSDGNLQLLQQAN